jgi:hypothetical protein
VACGHLGKKKKRISEIVGGEREEKSSEPANFEATFGNNYLQWLQCVSWEVC